MNENIKAIDRIYTENEKALLEEGFYSEKEVSFLKQNYENTKNRILKSNSEVKDKFCDQVIAILETTPNNDSYNANLADSILVYYNFYKTYGEDLFNVKVQDLHLAISVFENLIGGGEKEIENMNHVIDPIVYRPDLVEELRSVEHNESMVAHHLESVTYDYKNKMSDKTMETLVMDIVKSRKDSMSSSK